MADLRNKAVSSIYRHGGRPGAIKSISHSDNNHPPLCKTCERVSSLMSAGIRPKKAALVYDAAAASLHREFARPNFEDYLGRIGADPEIVPYLSGGSS